MAFDWTPNIELAAELVAAGEVTDFVVADRVGVTDRTIRKWRTIPEFAAKVDEIREEAISRMRKRAISFPERRLQRLNDTWMRLQQVIEERAADPALANAAGGRTGLLCRMEKAIGSGPGQVFIEEFALDGALLRELREIEKQAAQELGQWVDRADVTTNGETLTISVVEVVKPPGADDADDDATETDGD